MVTTKSRVHSELSFGNLTADRLHPEERYFSVDRVQLKLSAELSHQLRQLANQQGVSLFVTLLSSWTALLGRWSGQDEVAIGAWIENPRRPLISISENAAIPRIRMRDDATVKQLLQQVGAAVSEVSAQQLDQRIEALKDSRSHGPILQVLTELSDTPTAIIASAELHPSSLKFDDDISVENAEAQSELALSLKDGEEGLTGTLEYAADLFDRMTIERMLACWEVLLDGMVTSPQQLVHQLPILTAAESAQVLHRFNDTATACPHDRLIHELFEEQVPRSPDAIAVVYENLRLTYAEINARANQLARYLRDRGVGPDQLVGLWVDRSPEMVVGLLGILKAGGAYVPLDPSYPSERRAYILNDAAPRWLLAQERLRSTLSHAAAETITLDSDWSEIAKWSEENLEPRSFPLTAQNLAYVIYTSGSTGQPKGVAAEHRGMVNRIAAQRTIEGFSGDDICCQKTSIGFVDACFEILGPLSHGRPLVLAPAAAAKDVEQLISLIEKEQVTRLVTVPSLAELLLQSDRFAQSLQSLRSWTLSGEELKRDLLRRLQEQVPKCTFLNLYGSSEVAADVTCYIAKNAENNRVPIGRPIANTQIYILDRHLQAAPIGVTGEIYIGGAGLARGYLNWPALTAERFIADPFGHGSGARLYKSGDLGRWRGDGLIDYLGRNDQQVKIRGYRIEVGEIEAWLARHEQVMEAVVVAHEDSTGEKQLAAYITRRDQSGVDAEVLRTHLKAVLPEYMVPSAIVILESLPVTPSGKLDRRALPAPDIGAFTTRQYEPVQGEVEEVLAGIWQELLRVNRVGRQDNFFELGGNSLLIVQMMERLRRVGLSADVGRVFESPTLADLASALTGEVVGQFAVPENLIPRDCKEITPEMLPLVELKAEHIERIVQSVLGGAENVQDIYPLSPLQEGILFHHLLDEAGGDAYIVTTLLSVSSGERLQDLTSALQWVIDRHDVLRTAVLWEQLPRPVQVVYRHTTLPVQEISVDPTLDLGQQIMEWTKPERQRMDLRRAPLIRLRVASDLHSEKRYALLQIHHIVEDDLSLKILISEVLAYLDGRSEKVPESAAYRDHVAHALMRAQTHDAETFFHGKLGDLEEPTAPFELLDVRGDGSRIDEARQEFEPALAQRVRNQARRLGVSVATLFHAAWGLVVACTSGRDDVVFGSVLLGRLQGNAGTKRIMGMLINTLPLRLRLQNATARELIEQTQRELVELLNHEQASLAVAQRCSRIAGSIPLFSAVLNYRHGAPDSDAEWSSAAGIRELAYQYRTNYPIMLSVDDLGEEFALTAQTDRRIDPRRMLAYMSATMQSLLAALEQASPMPVLALSILPAAERQDVINVFNATQARYPRGKLIHELFEEQVVRSPDASAAEYGGRSLTYAQLNDRANLLARYLRDRGVGPDQLVGVCVDRSLEMVVAVLGTLKAGGAYVPLDPSYPLERLQYMLEDSAPRVVLMQNKLREMLPTTRMELIALDTMWSGIGSYAVENLLATELGLTVENLVYVIYTSGSTGRPKGTAMAHGSMGNLIEWHRKSFFANEGKRVLQFAALSFDVAFQEIFSTLCTGGTLVLVDEWIRRDARALTEFLSSHSIDRLFIPPLMLKVLAEYCQDASALPPGRLQDVITAGEQLHITPEISSFFKQLKGCRLHNHYGPTESHVVTALTLTGNPGEWPSLPTIGRPISNAQIYILNRQRQPTPTGVVGEIYIGGAGLARGYLNLPELTRERFIADPVGANPQAHLYKTGDLGCWRADGTIEYLGRNDTQVKIRGYRIELGEIEAQLVRQENVREAVVVPHEDVVGEKRLVAYVTLHPHNQTRVEELRAYVQTELPEYMVPSAFVILEAP